MTAAAQRNALLAAVRRHRAGITIYGLAQQLRRPYRRVFEGVRRLAAEGALRVEPVVRSNRRATLVRPAHGPSRDGGRLPGHLSEAERFALREIAERLERLDPRIRSMRLFGSRARGEARWDSDIDLAVRVRGPRDAALEHKIVAAFAEVEWAPPLEGALRVSPLVLFDAAPRAAIRAAIEAQGVTVWKARS